MIKAITFDLDGVYFVHGKEHFISNLTKHGVTDEEAIRVFLKSNEMNNLYKCGKMSDGEFWTWALTEWKLDLSVKEITTLLIQGYEVNNHVVNVVRNARKIGYKTLICSNNFPARIEGLQRRFQFLNDFDANVFSYEVGATKPSLAIFQELVSRAEVNADEIVFADDNGMNLAGAKSVGIQTFTYSTFDQFMIDLANLGVTL